MKLLIFILLIYSYTQNLLAHNIFTYNKPINHRLVDEMIFDKDKGEEPVKSNNNLNFKRVTGYIIDGVEFKTISDAFIEVFYDVSKTPIATYKTNENGFFDMQIPVGHEFFLKTGHQDYNVRFKKLKYKNTGMPDYFKVYLNPINKNNEEKCFRPFIEPRGIPIKSIKGLNLIDLPQLYFGWDEYYFDEQSAKVLEDLIAMLNANPELEVSINSYVDCRTPKEYAIDLTQKRSAFVKKYLCSNDIAPDRLKAHGMGCDSPIIPCNTENKCTEKQHLANRRIEFIILNPLKSSDQIISERVN